MNEKGTADRNTIHINIQYIYKYDTYTHTIHTQIHKSTISMPKHNHMRAEKYFTEPVCHISLS